MNMRRGLWLCVGIVALACSRREAATAGGRVGDTLQQGGAGRGAATAGQASANRSSYQQFLPDSTKTPGATFPVTKADICTPGYSSKVRNVPSAMKRAVYASYGITQRDPGEYEVDHLISLELGGSNSQRNLWPQSFRTQPWNAHVKDALENQLHNMVCNGQVSLEDAQHAIATDWIAAYRKYVSPNPSDARPARGSGRTR
jgi:hypothetical protein